MNPARFLRHVEQTSGCWLWRGNLSDCGHGRVRVHGRLRPARRVAYELWVGPIPRNLVVVTSCGDPSCVRPSHLALLDPAVGPLPIWVRRIAADQVRTIIQSPLPVTRLARTYGVSRRWIYSLKRSFNSSE